MNNWKSVNWAKSNAEIAAEVGVTIQAVYYQRKKRPRFTPDPLTLSSIDWTMPNKAIAGKLGCSVAHVSNLRREIRMRWAKEKLKPFDFISCDSTLLESAPLVVLETFYRLINQTEIHPSDPRATCLLHDLKSTKLRQLKVLIDRIKTSASPPPAPPP